MQITLVLKEKDFGLTNYPISYCKLNKFWILKYISNSKTNLDPLMGWSGSNDTSKQIILKFNSKEEAIDYAELHSLKYRILNNNTKKIKPKSYADNFSFKRKGLWSH